MAVDKDGRKDNGGSREQKCCEYQQAGVGEWFERSECQKHNRYARSSPHDCCEQRSYD